MSVTLAIVSPPPPHIINKQCQAAASSRNTPSSLNQHTFSIKFLCWHASTPITALLSTMVPSAHTRIYQSSSYRKCRPSVFVNQQGSNQISLAQPWSSRSASKTNTNSIRYLYSNTRIFVGIRCIRILFAFVWVLGPMYLYSICICPFQKYLHLYLYLQITTIPNVHRCQSK